jgi:hypothetical protein
VLWVQAQAGQLSISASNEATSSSALNSLTSGLLLELEPLAATATAGLLELLLLELEPLAATTTAGLLEPLLLELEPLAATTTAGLLEPLLLELGPLAAAGGAEATRRSGGTCLASHSRFSRSNAARRSSGIRRPMLIIAAGWIKAPEIISARTVGVGFCVVVACPPLNCKLGSACCGRYTGGAGLVSNLELFVDFN